MEVLKVVSDNPSSIIEKSAKLIKKGGVVIFPTDTLYGLLTDARNEMAVKKVFKIKKRQRSRAIPVFVKDIKTAKKLAFISKNQEKILKKVWFTRPNFWNNYYKEKKLVKIAPKIWAGKGKATFVLKRKNSSLKIFSGDKKRIGIRIPDYKLLNILLSRLNFPLTGTSANISGKSASGNIKKILSQFKDKKHKPDLVIDAGNLPKSKPSTVLDLTTFPPTALRR